MKRILRFELFETSKNTNIKKMQIAKAVQAAIDTIPDDVEGTDWNVDFVEALKDKGFEVFVGDDVLKDFEPQEADAIFGPEDYPGDTFGFFVDGLVVGVGSQDLPWKDFYKEYGPAAGYKDHEVPVIVARKK